MRYRLHLKNTSKICNIPINYPSYISASIYNLLRQANAGYSGFLHNKGYEGQGKRFKYFTFGKLEVPQKSFELVDKRMLIHTNKISLTVSFFVDEAIDNFLKGVFKGKYLRITDKQAENEFYIDNVETLDTPILSEKITLRTLSPLVIIHQNKNDTQHTYLAPDDPRYAELFITNLKSKYQTYAKHIFASKNHSSPIEPIFEFLKYSGKRPSKLINIKPGKENIKVRGYLFDFQLTAPIGMLEVGYYGGFGAHCAQGFGCCTLI